MWQLGKFSPPRYAFKEQRLGICLPLIEEACLHVTKNVGSRQLVNFDKRTLTSRLRCPNDE